MTLHTRLLLMHGVLFGSLLIMAVGYLLSLQQWREAADDWASIYRQDAQAEAIRSTLYRQTGRALDYLGGDTAIRGRVWQLDSLVDSHLAELKVGVRAREEVEHIEGVEETWYEMHWVLERILVPLKDQDSSAVASARTRLLEIADEAADEVATLTQYYRTRLNTRMTAASRYSDYARLATGAVLILAFAHVVALVFLLRRWLIQPIGQAVQATQAIRDGRFDARLAEARRDEWGELARAINHMAASLGAMQRQLGTRERMTALGEAAAYTAHNIKNPLAGIRMTAQVTQSEIGDPDPDTAQALQDIVDAVDRLDGWVTRFMDFARPLELNPAPTDIGVLVENVCDLARRHRGFEHVNLATRIENDTPRLNVDATLLEQAVFVVVTNACESGAKHVNVAVHQGDQAAAVMIEIIDDGPGISPRQQEKLFLAFSSDKEGGTGLGLAQAKTIIDLHGGQIHVSSDPARGTRVCIELVDTSVNRT